MVLRSRVMPMVRKKTAKLVVKLKESGRTDELIKMTDKKELERLYKEYNIQ